MDGFLHYRLLIELALRSPGGRIQRYQSWPLQGELLFWTSKACAYSCTLLRGGQAIGGCDGGRTLCICIRQSGAVSGQSIVSATVM